MKPRQKFQLEEASVSPASPSQPVVQSYHSLSASDHILSQPIIKQASIHGSIFSPALSPLLHPCSPDSFRLPSSLWPPPAVSGLRRGNVLNPYSKLIIQAYCSLQSRGPKTKTLIHLCQIKLCNCNSFFVSLCESLQVEFL